MTSFKIRSESEQSNDCLIQTIIRSFPSVSFQVPSAQSPDCAHEVAYISRRLLDQSPSSKSSQLQTTPQSHPPYQKHLHPQPYFRAHESTLLRSLATMEADPYVQKASQDAPTQQKAEEVESIIDHVKTAMLTTRHNGGALNSRAMVPASKKGLVFEFVANNHSEKFEDLQNDPSCNVSFYDPSNTDWVSVSGQAKIIEDHEEIKKIWNSSLSAWFGNLGDGKHTGNYDDPRVAAIQVKPTEIRYWNAKSKISQTMDVAKAKITGNAAAPGVLRVINNNELGQLRDINGKHV
ncbi:hypothetical protein PCASD_04634 [Puccinia coronata f. sp. avenae]|nr:hypothetical protein PCASD_04634 [Puccinia coronata f. sp. avenae]